MGLHRLKPAKDEMVKTTKAMKKANRGLKKNQVEEGEKTDSNLARPVVAIGRSLSKSLMGSAAERQVRCLWEITVVCKS